LVGFDPPTHKNTHTHAVSNTIQASAPVCHTVSMHWNQNCEHQTWMIPQASMARWVQKNGIIKQYDSMESGTSAMC